MGSAMAGRADTGELEYQAMEEIFTELELGEDPAQWPELDAETKKRIQRAAPGVSWRDWNDYWGYCFHLDKNNGKELFQERVLFAIHGGIPAKKAAWLLDETTISDYDQALAAVLRRGDRFATALTRELIERASAGRCMLMALELRHRLDLDTAFTPAFGMAWAVHMDGIWSRPIENSALEVELAWAVELFELGAAVPGDNEAIMAAAVGVVNRGLMDTGAVISLILQNLNMVARPLDRRRVWDTLRELEVPESTIQRNYRSFLEALSAGDGGSFYEELVPVLVAPDEDGDARLMSVVLAATMTTTKKARRQLLQWLRHRPAPTNPDLGDQVLEVLSEQDPLGAFDKEMTTLRQAWDIATPVSPTEQQELVPWIDPPAVWTPDALLPQDTSADAELLIAQLSELSRLTFWDSFPAIRGAHLDRALALIWRMERREPGSAALICAGMPTKIKDEPNPFAEWGNNGRATQIGKDSFTAALLNRIRNLSAIISSPRDVSLHVQLDDLIAALESYGTGEVIAADVRLALSRLKIWDSGTPRATEAQLNHLSSLKAVFTDEELPSDASSHKVGAWVAQILRKGKPPVGRGASLWEYPSGGADYLTEVDPRLAANLAAPWNSEIATLLVSELNSPYEDQRQPAEQAVADGYHRGLLDPGMVQVKQFDRSPTGQLARLATLADGLLALAYEEEMLCVAWPILSDLVNYSAGDARTVTGLKRVLEVMAQLAPSVFTQKGVPEEAKDIPGVRQIAQRSGSAAIVKLARNIVALAPEREIDFSFPELPPSRKLWAGRNVGVPVAEDETQEEWHSPHTGKTTINIARSRLKKQLLKAVNDGGQNTWNTLTETAKRVEAVAFTKVAAEFIEDAGQESVGLADWILWALRRDEFSRTNPTGLVSRSWPLTRHLLAWAGQTPKLARETGVILDAALAQAPEVVDAAANNQADLGELMIPELDHLSGKSTNVARKVAHLEAWLRAD